MSFYLGIDIGTFESKGVIVDGKGRIIATASKPHKMLVPQPGWAEHRPKQDWWGDFSHICKKLLTESKLAPEAIRAVGTSAIGPCMLPVDADGEALSNAALYGVDARAAVEIEELTAAIGAKRILERCGNALTSQSVGPKILWLKKNRPEIFARAARIVTSTTYLVQKLTGECVIDHYSAANFSPLYVVDRQDWSSELAPDIIELDRLPKLLWSTDIAGHVTKKAARATGLAAGTPVIAGTIDAASEALSVGVVRPGDMMVMYGSTIFTIMLSKGRIEDARLWYAPWLFKGEHGSMAGLSTSGTLTHWFRDNAARELEPAEAFARLAREAEASPPGAKGLVVLPYFSGERTPIHDPQAKGVIFGLNLTHDRGDIYRALARRDRVRHQPHHRDLSRDRPDAAKAARRRRRHEEPRMVAGDVGCFGDGADGLQEDHRRLLWRCVPRRACGRRRREEGHSRLESRGSADRPGPQEPRGL